MSAISTEAVTAEFEKLTKLTKSEAENYAQTVGAAIAYFKRLLRREPEGDEVGLCEYAAACKAFFDYTVLCAATSKRFSTQTGGIFTRISEDRTVINAERLLRNAYATLPEGLIRDDGFIFEGTEG